MKVTWFGAHHWALHTVLYFFVLPGTGSELKTSSTCLVARPLRWSHARGTDHLVDCLLYHFQPCGWYRSLKGKKGPGIPKDPERNWHPNFPILRFWWSKFGPDVIPVTQIPAMTPSSGRRGVSYAWHLWNATRRQFRWGSCGFGQRFWGAIWVGGDQRSSKCMVHPGRLTWNLRIRPWKRTNIFQTITFRFYANLQGCKFHGFYP